MPFFVAICSPVMPSISQSKRLNEIKSDFERGIFLAVYNSRKQKLQRFFAVVILSMKHILRGLLFSWPLYLLALASYAVPGASGGLFLLLLLPAIYISWVILSKGIKEDYKNLVEGYILFSGYLGRVLLHGKI